MNHPIARMWMVRFHTLRVMPGRFPMVVFCALCCIRRWRKDGE